jgi:dCMP deaminase
MMTSKLWDYRFLQLAETVSSWSKDPSRKVGSVVVDNKRRVVSLGYNGFPRGVEDSAERYADRELKLKLVCHAERNALDNSSASVEGATLYTTLFPCNECVKSIIQRGISKVVTIVPEPGKNQLFYLPISYMMLKESGVELHQYDYGLFERWKNGTEGFDPFDSQVEHL